MLPSLSALASSRNMLIVAHPDDEVIFFYDYIRKYKPFVVCLTNGDHLARRLEFSLATAALGVNGVILDFPDVVDEPIPGGDLEGVIAYFLAIKQWENVATHNLEGEYGHIHHIQISECVQKMMGNSPARLLMPPISQELEVAEFAVEHVEEKILFLQKFYRTQARQLLSPDEPYRRWVYFEGSVSQSLEHA